MTAQSMEGQILTDSVEIHFTQSKWNLDRAIADNDSVLKNIDHRLTAVFGDSVWILRHVGIIGGASPEGPLKFNEFLSEHRAATLFDYLSKYRPLDDADKAYHFLGRDWEGVYLLALSDSSVPFRDESIALLQEIVNEKKNSGNEPAKSLERMKALRGGVPFKYLYQNIFPKVRASKVILNYERIIRPDLVEQQHEAIQPIERIDTVYFEREIIIHDTTYVNTCPPCRPFYMDTRTNMFNDALALPNIGAEFYLGKNLSLGANWLYAWWSKSAIHRFWRAYGGEIFSRWWLGRKAHEKPLTGHHLGMYGQFYTYDFEWGGEGEMGGQPKGTLWDRGLWGVGVEYGYSLPIARRLNLDFSLGFGYTTGYYNKYKPKNGRYEWQSTHRRHLFAPTKVEVALVWLIGCDNYNRSKARSN